MKISFESLLRPLTVSIASFIALAAMALSSQAADQAQAKNHAPSGALEPLALKLPPPAFKGTPKDLQLSSYVEPLSDKPRPPMMVPPGLKNIAKGSKLTCSDKNVMAEDLAKLADGDKEASDQSVVLLRKGTQ